MLPSAAPMIDLTTFNWLASERVWMRPCLPAPQLEIVIAGDEQAPDTARVLLANEVLKRTDVVQKEATAYLDAFVDRRKFAPNGEWFLVSVEFGRRGDEPYDEFLAYFYLEDDTYDLWSVLLRHTRHAGVVPKAFSRQQQ
jgi:hypothetical protein